MPRGFVTQELLYVVAILAILMALCLPVLAAMRDGRISLAIGMSLLTAACLTILLPWWLMRRVDRHRMGELSRKHDEPADS